MQSNDETLNAHAPETQVHPLDRMAMDVAFETFERHRDLPVAALLSAGAMLISGVILEMAETEQTLHEMLHFTEESIRTRVEKAWAKAQAQKEEVA